MQWSSGGALNSAGIAGESPSTGRQLHPVLHEVRRSTQKSDTQNNEETMMTDATTARGTGRQALSRTITPKSDEWPEFAPPWAACAVLDAGDETVTFERQWSIPSTYRGTEPLVVVSVEQIFTYNAKSQSFVESEPRVTSGPCALWAEYRREEIASTLRDIANALAP